MKCEVCDDPYNLVDRIPLVLECGHTCCKRCLARHVERLGHVQCPWDRKSSSRSLEELPKNFALVEAANLDQHAAALGHGISLDRTLMLDERELEVSGRSLGRGATGQVLEGMYKDRPVAVKVVDIRGASLAVRKTLQREVHVVLATAGECRHTCQYRGATIKGMDFCLVMRKYDKSLADVINEQGAAGGLPIPRVLRYSRQILGALAELHANKIIMGDLKPHNLLLDNLLDELVVTDFGLSRIVDHTLGAYKTPTVQGTPNYMPPECLSDNTITAAADMWSWACTVLHMATGEAPFARLSSHQIVGEVCYGGRSPEIPANLPTWLRGLLQGCLSRDPAGRPTVTQATQAMEAVAALPLLGVSVQWQGPQQGQQHQQLQYQQQQQQQQFVAHAVQPRGDALKQLLLRISVRNWHSGNSLTTWNGLTWAANDTGLLLAIKIHRVGIRDRTIGTLPPSWSSLAALRSLEVRQQKLTGELPATWSALTALTRLHVPNNQLTGPLPACWGALTALQDLNVACNNFKGELPPQWSSLGNLVELRLNDNQLSGPLPRQWSALSNLGVLWLSRNQLSGPMPPQWSALHNLKELWLSDNQLKGALPPPWSALSNLDVLWLSRNQLNGPLPPQWSALSNLKELWLSDNQLRGALPPQWSALSNLEGMGLSNNQLNGSLPAQWSALSNLKGLWLSDNQLSDSLPSQWSALRNLTTLEAKNQVRGSGVEKRSRLLVAEQ